MNATSSFISNRRVWYPMAGILHGGCGMWNAECGIAARADDSRADLPFTLCIPHSTFRIAMPVQAIAWSPSGAVRIVDQRALPEAKIERDLETGEAVADAIRTLQLRGAPLIGIAAAMGLVAGTRELRAAPDRKRTRLNSSHSSIAYAGFW